MTTETVITMVVCFLLISFRELWHQRKRDKMREKHSLEVARAMDKVQYYQNELISKSKRQTAKIYKFITGGSK